MKTIIGMFKPAFFPVIIVLTCMLLVSGCARYARTVNTLYEPSASIQGGSGEVYLVIPENQQTQSQEIKWVLGKVRNNRNEQIDEVLSPRSPAEIIQAAFTQEFRRAGYTVIPTSRRPEAGQRVIELSKTEIELDQTSDIADIKAKCRVVAGMDVIMDGKLIKRLQYEASSSRLDVKDRDLLAGTVLRDALQSVMHKAMPELHGLFGR